MMVEFAPPLVACVVSRANYSQIALRRTKQCVIAIPTRELAGQIVDVGNCSGDDIEKFQAFHLTPLPASRVASRRRMLRQSRMRSHRHAPCKQI